MTTDDVLTRAAAGALFAAALVGVSFATRALRAYERDYGRQQAQGIDGPVLVTTTILINTERIRLANRCLFMLIAILLFTTDPSGWARVGTVAVLCVIAGLEDYKSFLWRKAQRALAAYERTRRMAGAERHDEAEG